MRGVRKKREREKEKGRKTKGAKRGKLSERK